MSLKDQLQSSNSSKSSDSLQDQRSSTSCSAPTTSAASKSMSKRKSADANDLGVDNPKRVRLHAYLVSMFGTIKRCFNVARYQSSDWLEYSVKMVAAFCSFFRNFESKAGGDFRECAVNQLLQPMAIVIGSMLLK